ncbi:hypothetical protein INS49_014120 [Diaporthe citri]|uniref:uncharacterized protein n=1 Tax=Diaporthe citri TaxID=83186 RepID=UPI001C80C06A|nr:uncharacterized protein INS49_014120 [Diaporthe citri]KAG6358236.1 hypothetical protein INS49_014120 [Diaporthe citri]
MTAQRNQIYSGTCNYDMFNNKCSTSATPTLAKTPVGVYAVAIYLDANGQKPLSRIEVGSVDAKIGGVSMGDAKFHLEYTDPEMNIDGDLRFDVYQMS